MIGKEKAVAVLFVVYVAATILEFMFLDFTWFVSVWISSTALLVSTVIIVAPPKDGGHGDE